MKAKTTTQAVKKANPTRKARVLVKDYDAITVNVKAQDSKLSHIDRITAEIGTMRIALAAEIFKHVKASAKTPKAKQAESARLIKFAQDQIKADGYEIQNSKALWSTVTNALNLHLFPNVTVNVEDKIVDGKQTFKKAKAAEVLKMPARKVNNSASSLKIAAGIADARATNTAANKTVNKKKRAARVPQAAAKAITEIRASGWSDTFSAVLDPKAPVKLTSEFVSEFFMRQQQFILLFNKAGYTLKVESVVPTAKAKPTTKAKPKAKAKAAAKPNALEKALQAAAKR